MEEVEGGPVLVALKVFLWILLVLLASGIATIAELSFGDQFLASWGYVSRLFSLIPVFGYAIAESGDSFLNGLIGTVLGTVIGYTWRVVRKL